MSYRMALALLLASGGWLLGILYGSDGSILALLVGWGFAFGGACLAWNAGFREHEKIVSESETRP